MSVNGDHLLFAINYHKGDQTGTQGPIFHPVYANPTKWYVCPAVALGIILLPFDQITPLMDIFQGCSVDSLFNDWLKSIFDENRNVLKVDTVILTSHMTRKGAPSFAVSVPGMVNVIQVFLRAGWNLGGVLPDYIRAENGGPETLGRFNCLLPHNTEFSLLPPRFKPDAVIPWSDMMKSYDTIPKNMQLVLSFVVPSIIYFAEEIAATLHPNNPLFLSRFWRNGYQYKLKDMVISPVKMFCPDTHMIATGIPPLIALQYQNEINTQQINSKIDLVQSRFDEAITIMESKSYNKDNDQPVTQSNLTECMTQCMSQIIDSIPLIVRQEIDSAMSRHTSLPVSSSASPICQSGQIYFSS